jgi:hypothetical protein
VATISRAKALGGREVLGRPRLRVGAGEVERADRPVALAHRCAQPCPDARRQRQGSKVGPAWLAGKIPAGNRGILQEGVQALTGLDTDSGAHGARLRREPLTIPARVIRHARGLELRFPPGPQILPEVLARLRALPAVA